MKVTWRDGLSRWRGDEALDATATEAIFWWLVRLRWAALAGVALVLLLAGPVAGGLRPGSAPWLWGVAASLLVYNSTLAALGPARSRWLGHLAGQIVVDCLALAGLVHFAGGIENPFLLLFVLHVVTAGIVLQRGQARALLVVAVTLATIIVIGEGTGLLAHHCLRRDAASCAAVQLDLWSLAVLGGLVLTLCASSSFTRSLTDRLRRSQHSLRTTVGQLERETEQLATARAAIEREHSRLQVLLDCMADAVIFCDAEGEVLLSNQRARELSRSMSSAQAERDGRSVAGGLAALEALLRASEDGHASRTDHAFELNGRTFEPTYSGVRTDDGEALGVVMVARDITERRAMERHLQHEERLSVVGKLAATVAHEINNPIGVVSLYSQHALAKLPDDSPVRDHLETIRRNADSCQKIIGELLELARPREPERRELDLRPLCDDIVESVRPLAEQSGVTVSVAEHARDVSILVRGDADQLRQAVLNLTLNAIEAGGEGDTVSLGAWEGQEGDSTVRIVEIHDTGSGIPPEDLEHVFQPFFTTKDTGTGLGLAVAENIVKSHGGHVEVESTAGLGTTFRIALPDPELDSSPPRSENEPSEGELTERGVA